MQVSLSQINAFRECEQKYAYRYVEQLEPIQAATPLELGIALHAYLASYYQAVKDGVDAASAHASARTATGDAWQATLTELAEVTAMLGADDAADDFANLAQLLPHLIERYFVTHGLDDAQQQEILLVEQPVVVPVTGLDVSKGVIDLVTRDRASGKTLIWEHKSHKSIPSTGYRLRDLQTTLYTFKLRETFNIRVDAVQWNYLRTVVPPAPARNKNDAPGKRLSRAKIDTTAVVYMQAINETGEDPADYRDILIGLANAERDRWFPRFRHALVAQEDILLRDYTLTTERIVFRRRAWAEGNEQPVRTLSRACDYCAYRYLCDAVIMGGDADELIGLRYTRRPQRSSDPHDPIDANLPTLPVSAGSVGSGDERIPLWLP